MHIAVLVKQVPDTEEVRIDPKTRQPDVSRASLVVSQYDKNAVEAAVQLKEDGPAERVTAISLGGDKVEETLREVIAMGCDDAVAINADTGVDSLPKAKLLAKAIEDLGGVDLVIAAEESADSHTASTGPMVAALLDWPVASYVFSIEADGDAIKVERDVDEGVEVDRVGLPAVVSVLEGIGDPRLPALMQILQAKSKPLEKKTASDLGVDAGAVIQLVGNIAPEESRKQDMTESDGADAAEWLLARLKKEGVI